MQPNWQINTREREKRFEVNKKKQTRKKKKIKTKKEEKRRVYSLKKGM